MVTAVQSIPRMRYRVGERVGFRTQPPTQEIKHAPRNRGEYGPENCGIGTVKAVIEKEDSYVVSMSGRECTIPESDILGSASWNAQTGKWQIDPI